MNHLKEYEEFDDAPEPTTYALKNGKTLTLEEDDIKGMAGEPMHTVVLKVDDKVVHFKDVKSLMDPKDAEELRKYLDDVSDGNDASAVSWTI